MSCIATIGFFDGVHKGHCYLFEQLRRHAAERGLQPLIVTFAEHPRTVLQSDYVPQLLTSLEERRILLERFGEVLVLSFAEVHTLTAAQFMDFLRTQYNVTAILMGYDHRFGSDCLHRPQDYKHIGAQSGVEIIHIGEFMEGEWHVSSTEIRAALENGNIAVANDLLGRSYSLRGLVVHGQGLGKSIGFPTANLQPLDEGKIIPKNGVYAVRVHTPTMDNAPAFVNIGTNPTVGLNKLSIEVHIPSFKGDLYNQILRLRFERYIRDEKRFDSLPELTEQIKADIDSSLRRDE